MIFGRVDDVNLSEDHTAVLGKGRGRAASPGSESTAWRNRESVNVGDPGRSLGNESTDEQG